MIGLRLSEKEVKAKIESAFPPYECVTQWGPFRHTISFRVYRDVDDAGTTFEPVEVSDLRSGQLDDYIKDWRGKLRDMGYDRVMDQ